jgi:selenide,water dikinase
MNLVAFPSKKMDLSVLRAIIQGGIDKISEAGAVLIGGHSIEDNDIKYGLSVTGTIHPDRILKKGGVREKDRLILTKPLGIGIVNTAIKAGLASGELKKRAIRQMAQLNQKAAEIMSDFNVSACTDITGFGLLGHLAEMVCGTGLSIRINSNRVPILPQALDFADMGLIPTAAYNNRKFREHMVRFDPAVPRNLRDVLFDPQTSGGLLICVKAQQADSLTASLHDKGILQAAEIGEINSSGNEIITIDR